MGVGGSSKVGHAYLNILVVVAIKIAIGIVHTAS